MAISRRSSLAIGVFIILAAIVAAAKWYEDKKAAPVATADAVAVNVTSGADRGPGSLREALFVVATATTDARITIKVQKIVLESALPPLVNAHGVSIVAPPGTEIDAKELHAGPVFDVAAARTSIEGLLIRNCPGAAILLRSTQFHLQTTTITSCDVGVDVAENASDILLEHNRFANDRVGLRFAASSRSTSVLNNDFTADTDAGVWAVRSQPDLRGAAISVRDNRFQDDRTGIVAGNISLLFERNDVTNAREAAVHLVGAGAIIRGNRISGGAGMGVIAENARSAIIESNELDGTSAYGILVRNSSDTLVRANRLHNCGYGMAFVLGDSRNPSTAVDNTIIEPKFNGIDVIGDNPILRRNQVMRPHALALHVEDFQPSVGAKVRGEPLLDSNTFENAPVAATPKTAGTPGAAATNQ